jgi:N utilization substance protein B
MLSRRHLRIRVMQALYAWHQSDKDGARAERELFNGTEHMYRLYLHVLQFMLEMAHQEELYYADMPASALTGKRKKAVFHIGENAFIAWLKENKEYKKRTAENKISWQQDNEVVQKAFFELRKMPLYTDYINAAARDKETDIAFIKSLVGELISKKEFVRHVIEEKNIYWAEGFDVVCSMIIRTVESGKSADGFVLSGLYKDEEEDLLFMKNLLQKTIRDDDYYTKLIAARTESWDTDRIALVDIILMKMALCEILNFSNIPVKVSINEYIDISKDYSTPNSKGFINGVIDNIANSLKAEGKIQKTGRGLVE